MTLLDDVHADHGAQFTERGERRLVDEYGRPERAVAAVRNGVGTIELGYGIVSIAGEDRIDYVDNVISNRVPTTDGEGCYALLLDPQGRIEIDMYVYNAGERLLLFVPPGSTPDLVADWREKVFIQDVTIENATGEFGVFGVHGPKSTEKVASVLDGAGAPEPALSFVRGTMGDAGVTVIATDNPTGEEGYEVICAADSAADVFDTLLNRGPNAAPFGYRTWDVLTLEAGTPTYPTELDGRVPNTIGLEHAVDLEKGCFVGQEVVSKVANIGRPSSRLVGLELSGVPDAGATVRVDGREVGTVTRAVESPTLASAIAFAFVDPDAEYEATTVDVSDENRSIDGQVRSLPFVDGSARSLRRPGSITTE